MCLDFRQQICKNLVRYDQQQLETTEMEMLGYRLATRKNTHDESDPPAKNELEARTISMFAPRVDNPLKFDSKCMN